MLGDHPPTLTILGNSTIKSSSSVGDMRHDRGINSIHDADHEFESQHRDEVHCQPHGRVRRERNPFREASLPYKRPLASTVVTPSINVIATDPVTTNTTPTPTLPSTSTLIQLENQGPPVDTMSLATIAENTLSYETLIGGFEKEIEKDSIVSMEGPTPKRQAQKKPQQQQQQREMSSRPHSMVDSDDSDDNDDGDEGYSYGTNGYNHDHAYSHGYDQDQVDFHRGTIFYGDEVAEKEAEPVEYVRPSWDPTKPRLSAEFYIPHPSTYDYDYDQKEEYDEEEEEDDDSSSISSSSASGSVSSIHNENDPFLDSPSQTRHRHHSSINEGIVSLSETDAEDVDDEELDPVLDIDFGSMHELIPFIHLAFSNGAYAPALVRAPSPSPSSSPSGSGHAFTHIIKMVHPSESETPGTTSLEYDPETGTQVLRLILRDAEELSRRRRRRMTLAGMKGQVEKGVFSNANISAAARSHQARIPSPLSATEFGMNNNNDASSNDSSTSTTTTTTSSCADPSRISKQRDVPLLSEHQLLIARDFLAHALPCYARAQEGEQPQHEQDEYPPAHVLITAPREDVRAGGEDVNAAREEDQKGEGEEAQASLDAEAGAKSGSVGAVDVMSVATCYLAHCWGEHISKVLEYIDDEEEVPEVWKKCIGEGEEGTEFIDAVATMTL